ncbi:MAG: acyl-CoA dehydrogenase, partial [Nitriliruptoraceae bacterium]
SSSDAVARGPTMSHHRSNLRDIEFNLFEVLGADDYLGTGPFAEFDGDQARMVLDELDRFSRESIWAESFAPTDRTPLQLTDDGDVIVPDELHQALTALYDAGWHLLPLATHLGGAGAPPTIRWAATELLFGGHATAALWPIGPLMAAVIDRLGTDGQRERIARTMVDRRWGGTMVLTEPDAGSDVGAGTTRAVLVSDNGDDDLGSVWHLTGVKRFITSADCQTHENTLHLVLARPEGAGPGTKGLSLFLVPKFHLTDDDSRGERNGVRIASLEHKLGIRGSATCELVLGDGDTPCVGWLLGDVHDGIRQMFQVIEYARMMIGTKSMATLSTGYLNALDHAKVRVQGPDLSRARDRTAPRVEIIRHPDVRRMLMELKAHVEGMRALVLHAGWVQDQAQLALHESAPGVGDDDTEVHDRWIAREDLLLPMVKGYCSEKAFELLSTALQIFGGAGFTEDHPLEQYLRDAKIDTLYEGTTGIQALDLLFRKIARDQGETLSWLSGEIEAFLDAADDPDGIPGLTEERRLLAGALEDTRAHLGVVLGHALASMQEGEETQIHLAGLHATPLLFSLTETTIGWLLLRNATVALRALEHAAGPDVDFYTGKVAAARWYCANALPHVSARRVAAEREDGALMELADAAF